MTINTQRHPPPRRAWKMRCTRWIGAARSRTAPQIVLDQQRRFIPIRSKLRDSHSLRASRRRKSQKSPQDARPLFDAMRAAQPGDDTLEPRLRDLEGHLPPPAARSTTRRWLHSRPSAEAQARVMIVILLVGAGRCAVDWLHRDRADDRQSLQRTKRNAPPCGVDGRARSLPHLKMRSALNESLTKLGFPKPNPMLAE